MVAQTPEDPLVLPARFAKSVVPLQRRLPTPAQITRALKSLRSYGKSSFASLANDAGKYAEHCGCLLLRSTPNQFFLAIIHWFLSDRQPSDQANPTRCDAPAANSATSRWPASDGYRAVRLTLVAKVGKSARRRAVDRIEHAALLGCHDCHCVYAGRFNTYTALANPATNACCQSVPRR
ncbi:hypothetical protein LMG28727_05507 [Paraburkholderia kirstenboschensis]|nr:hypothetical protein LMG28727_05507 [Paraburkholderia kirstenboschensis]